MVRVPSREWKSWAVAAGVWMCFAFGLWIVLNVFGQYSPAVYQYACDISGYDSICREAALVTFASTLIGPVAVVTALLTAFAFYKYHTR